MSNTTSKEHQVEIHDLQLRWIHPKDLAEVLPIERQSFRDPWTEADFVNTLHDLNAVGLVACRAGQIVGYMVYRHSGNATVLENLAVRGDDRRRRVGTSLIDAIKLTAALKRMLRGKRWRIELFVGENNTAGQLFFKAMGFKAREVWPNYWPDCEQDAYRMEYRQQ